MGAHSLVVAVIWAVAACGGSTGSVQPSDGKGALATPHPLTVQTTADTAKVASASIGPSGGQVRATAASGALITLVVPAGALLSAHTITLTPLASATGLPLKGGLLAGAQLGPDGLLLAKAATLTFKLAGGPPDGMKAYGFGYRHGGAEFHLVPGKGSGTSISLSVWHFSGAGVGAGTSSDASTQAGNAPTAPQDQVEQAAALGQPLVPLFLGWEAVLDSQLGQSPPNLGLIDGIYSQALVFGALATAANRPDLPMQLYLKMALGLSTAAQIALDRCRSAPDAVEALRVIRWIEWAQLHPALLQHLVVGTLEAGVVQCLRFQLDFTTMEDFAFGEGIHLSVESKGIALNAITAVPLKFAPAIGQLKYDSYVWDSFGIPYTVETTILREFSVQDVAMNLDIADSTDPASVVDGMSLTVDFGDTSETIHVQVGFPVPPLPLKSFYANGMQNMHNLDAVGPHLYQIRPWTAGEEPVFATAHQTCPCEQVPAPGLTEAQDTLFVLRHTPG